jgi:sporulation protein YlmC with PRC-barrel domain
MSDTSGSVVKSKNVVNKCVKNLSKENLGEINEMILDKKTGQVAYLVLESGAFLGLGGKLFALPWNSVNYNADDDCFILNIDNEKLKNAPGFDKDHWPDMADRTFGMSISKYYGIQPYWEQVNPPR